MKLFLVLILLSLCGTANSSELVLEISLPDGNESTMTIKSQKPGSNQISDLEDLYAGIGLEARCSAKGRKTICKIESRYENGSIRKGYPFFLFTPNSEVGLVNLSELKRIYGGSHTAAVFAGEKYSLLGTRRSSERKIYFDVIDDNAEYLLFTATTSESGFYFSSKIPGWMSDTVVGMAEKIESLYEQTVTASEQPFFVYIHFSAQPEESSWWGDVDSGGNVSLRFYGTAWEQYDKSAEISIIRFLAHEYFHRYYPYRADNEWMVEGAAEAFSTALLYKGRYLDDFDFKKILKDKAIVCRDSIQKNRADVNKYVNQDFAYTCGFFAFFNYSEVSPDVVKALGASIDPMSPLQILKISGAGSARILGSSSWDGENDNLKNQALKEAFSENGDVSKFDRFLSLIGLELGVENLLR